MYGDDTIKVPNISRLANEGLVYNNAFSTSGVCAPSRAALATGLYPSSFGANNMRTSSNTKETGLHSKMLSQLLREAGYYTTNNYKTDYQFKAPKTAWDENGIYAHWRNRPSDMPFFSIFNFTTTHESGLFEPYGIRKLEQRHYFSSDAEQISQLPNDHRVKTNEEATPIHIDKATEFPVPPYLPDTATVQHDLWKVYNNLAETDKQIGAIIKALEEDGLMDNTIIVFYSDHGGPMPRQKRLIYDSGLKVPLIIRFPKGYKAGAIEERLVSFVDFAPTTLAMAGLPVPEYMQGKNFFNTTNERKYIYAAADRFDGITDTIRAVRSRCYKYIRNYRPDTPYYLPVAYREKIPSIA
jgi:arylsulfatase A-like enzyme